MAKCPRDNAPRPVLIFATNAVEDYDQSAGTVSAPLVNENLAVNLYTFLKFFFDVADSPTHFAALKKSGLEETYLRKEAGKRVRFLDELLDSHHIQQGVGGCFFFGGGFPS